jgi:hypothetical protein
MGWGKGNKGDGGTYVVKSKRGGSGSQDAEFIEDAKLESRGQQRDHDGVIRGRQYPPSGK